MRAIVEYDSKPKQKEIVVVGKQGTAYIRKNIKEQTRVDEEGNEQVYYTAVEYTAPINPKMKIDAEFVNKVVAFEEEKEAKKVRTKRNELLDATDKELMADRGHTEEELNAWKAYRQALRDITKQSGFPFEVEFPVKP